MISGLYRSRYSLDLYKRKSHVFLSFQFDDTPFGGQARCREQRHFISLSRSVVGVKHRQFLYSTTE